MNGYAIIVISNLMTIRKIKKEIKKLRCPKFKRQAMFSLKILQHWSRSNHANAKSNMRICTHNFWKNGSFINGGKWFN